jgi:histidinol phosphatase-like PHP family hydrolase
VDILNNEPIDIYVNPTYLPDAIASQYDKLWTAERMRRVIEAAKRNNIAVELNGRYRLPSLAFVKMAKQAGVKFTCGTNNDNRNVGRIDYCREMIQQAGLAWQDFWVPGGEKAVTRKASALRQ